MSGDRERPRTTHTEDRLLREMHNLAGTRVWIADDVEEYAEDMKFVRDRRLSYADRRTKIGKFKMSVLIAIAGAVIAWAIPLILQWARTR